MTQATDDMVVIACKTFFGDTWYFAEAEMMRDAINAALTMLPVTGTATACFPELPPVQPKLIVEFRDGDGKVTERYEVETENVEQDVIDEAVALIKGGCDARTAMMLAKQSRSALEQEARDMAAAEYDKLAASNGRPDYHPMTFLTSYPTKEGYVREWWEERYLPIVQQRTAIDPNWAWNRVLP